MNMDTRLNAQDKFLFLEQMSSFVHGIDISYLMKRRHKKNWAECREILTQFLCVQIYTPTILRAAYKQWSDLPFWAQESTPIQIQELMRQSPQMTDIELTTALNAYHIQRAVHVLQGYQSCPIPLTHDDNIETHTHNLLSWRGERALRVLQQGVSQKRWSNKLCKIALKASHKHLIDLSYYRIKATPKTADILTIRYQNNKGKPLIIFPVLQMTQGCVNACSHCAFCATDKMAHMPYPMFLGLHQSLDRVYRRYPPKETPTPFSLYYHDSDPLSYQDPIIGADSGDVMLYLRNHHAACYFLTRGVTDKASRTALAKASLAYPIALSFVDTPAENMAKNIRQLNDTLDILALTTHNKLTQISHMTLTNGSSVPSQLFRGVNTRHGWIHGLGRARSFSKEAIIPVNTQSMGLLIRPSGNIELYTQHNDHQTYTILNSFFRPKHSEKSYHASSLWHRFFRTKSPTRQKS